MYIVTNVAEFQLHWQNSLNQREPVQWNDCSRTIKRTNESLAVSMQCFARHKLHQTHIRTYSTAATACTISQHSLVVCALGLLVVQDCGSMTVHMVYID